MSHNIYVDDWDSLAEAAEFDPDYLLLGSGKMRDSGQQPLAAKVA